jgi:hypothetical protein
VFRIKRDRANQVAAPWPCQPFDGYISMQETQLESKINPHHPWWKRILFAVLVGGFFGALEIWFYEFSLNRLMAAILSGGTFFAIAGLLGANLAKDRLKVIALCGIAGIAAGIAYWLVARPSVSLLLAVAIGLVGGIVFTFTKPKGSA